MWEEKTAETIHWQRSNNLQGISHVQKRHTHTSLVTQTEEAGIGKEVMDGYWSNKQQTVFPKVTK